MLLKRLFSRSKQTSPVRSVYEAIVALARQPVLYTDLAVPDTLDGRFDMIILHADAIVEHMQAGDDGDQAFAQELIDEVFRDMDRSLREMGVGEPALWSIALAAAASVATINAKSKNYDVRVGGAAGASQ